jgi:hypothetical protein
VLAAALDPRALAALLAGDEAKVDGDDGLVARVGEDDVLALAVAVEALPGEGAALQARAVDAAEQQAQGLLDRLGAGLGRDAEVATLALPLLAGGRLDLVAELLRVRDQVAAAQLLEGLGDRADLAAAVEAVVHALRDQGGGGRGLVVLDLLEQGDDLGDAHLQAGLVVGALGEDAGHARLGLGVEGGVLDLVDLVEGDQRADLLVGELLAAKQLTEQLQEAADRLVVALGAGRAGPQGGGDPHDQVDVVGE